MLFTYASRPLNSPARGPPVAARVSKSATAGFGMPVRRFGSCTPEETITMRAGALREQALEQQVGEQEVAEVVHGEGSS